MYVFIAIIFVFLFVVFLFSDGRASHFFSLESFGVAALTFGASVLQIRAKEALYYITLYYIIYYTIVQYNII